MDIREAKKLLWQQVRFRGATYTLESCVLWRDRLTSEYKYSAELLDSSRTVVRATLDEINKEDDNDLRD